PPCSTPFPYTTLFRSDIDLRFLSRADRDLTMARIRSVVDTSYVPGTGAKLEVFGEFLPLNETPDSERLYRHYAGCGEALGLSIPDRKSTRLNSSHRTI